MSVVDGLRNREPVFSSTGLKVRVLTDEEYDLLLDVVEAAELIKTYEDAGGNEWWEAHARLYAALAALETAQGAERPGTGDGA